jgi:uncharacterized protein YkwD
MARRSTPSALAATLAAGVVALLALAGCTSASAVTDEAPSVASTSSEVAQVAVDLPIPAVSAPPDAGGTAAPKPDVSVVPLPATTKPSGGTGGQSATVSKAVLQAAANYARQLYTLTNAARSAAGVAKLGWSSCAASAAVGRAARAVPKRTLVHEPLTFSCAHSWAGENLAFNWGTPQQMFDAWMASTGHRENILRPQFTSIGIGCVAYSTRNIHAAATRTSDIGGYLCSQVFLG